MSRLLRIDLHTHSQCSDGALSPADLVARAAAAGIEVLALTDHDTVSGVEEARDSAAAAGMILVPGVEISASWRSQALHVLGLWIDPAEARLREALDRQADRRRARMRRICARLGELGLPGDALLAAVESNRGLPTRAHLAAALVAGGHATSADDAFRRHLGRGKAANLAGDWPALADVVAWIRGAGGVASLAHPGRYRLSSGARRHILADFAAAGGGALEVITGSNAQGDSDTCAALAVRFGLAGSVGSDFHDPQLPWNTLGRLAKLPDCVTPVWRDHGRKNQ